MNKLIIRSVATMVLLSAGQCCATMEQINRQINQWISQLPPQPRGNNAQQQPHAHRHRPNNAARQNQPSNRFTDRAAYNRTHGDTFDNDLNYYSDCRHFRTETVINQDLYRRRIFENITCPAIRNTPDQQHLRDVIAYGSVDNSTNTEKITTDASDNWSETTVPFQIRANQATYNCQINTVQQNSVEAAINCYNVDRGARIAILNFADPEKPGGGVLNGKGAQEETLSRCTTAYASLISLKADRLYYDYNIRHWNDGKMPERILVSPNVKIILTDKKGRDEYTAHGVPNEGIPVAILTAAAFDYHNQINNVWLQRPQPRVEQDDVHSGMRQLVRNMLRGAIDNGCNTLVLGAWGTGVFNNKPEDIGRYFKEVLIDEGMRRYFRKVVFAGGFDYLLTTQEKLQSIRNNFTGDAVEKNRSIWNSLNSSLSFKHLLRVSGIERKRCITLDLDTTSQWCFEWWIRKTKKEAGADKQILDRYFGSVDNFYNLVMNNTAHIQLN